MNKMENKQTVEEYAEEIFLDDVREECKDYIENAIPINELYDGGKLHFFKEGAKLGAQWQASTQSATIKDEEIKRLREALKVLISFPSINIVHQNAKILAQELINNSL